MARNPIYPAKPLNASEMQPFDAAPPTTMQQLELLVDNKGAAHVIDMLAEVCSLKAEHLHTNWGDPKSAKAWEQLHKTLQKAYKYADAHRM